jgi:cytochrome c peroxidase
VEEFRAVFGGEQPVTADNAAKAVAAYERTLITPGSPYDRYVTGDARALTPQQARGMSTFEDLGCIACHRGPAFNGPLMPDGKGFFISFPFHPPVQRRSAPFRECLRDVAPWLKASLAEPGRRSCTGRGT